MAVLSKRDIKPFSKFKTFLLGFAGGVFFKKQQPAKTRRKVLKFEDGFKSCFDSAAI